MPVHLLKLHFEHGELSFNKGCCPCKERMQQALCYLQVGKCLFKSGVISEAQIHKHKGSVMYSSGI